MALQKPRAPNRLARSTSPYLRQHAENPVDWHEWNDEAFDRARREDKPILLSVGYSACHWCHVMAHESFEDDAIAAEMNRRFVCIKVDREERPDVDAIYQKVVQLMGQGGGWPLTVFLTPERRPFYGGTYFPPRPLYGRPSFPQVLEAVDRVYREKPEDVREQVEAFGRGMDAIEGELEEPRDDVPPPWEPAARRDAVARLLSRVDWEHGGFGGAPKFPNPTALELLLAEAHGDDELARRSAAALRTTLAAMYGGGIWDHLGGGFARYAVDRIWRVPHFEKMLYDNAQLLPLYAATAGLWPDDPHALVVVRGILDCLTRDLRAPSGGYFAALDADSEGEEGKFYCWTPAEVRAVLGEGAEAETLLAAYGVTDQGNFEHGWSILHVAGPPAEHAAAHAGLEQARARLLAHRAGRVPPHRDEKILTSWNALLVSGLARAALVVPDEGLARRCRTLALELGAYLVTHHVEPGGRVLRAAFEGTVHTRGYLDDVAFLGRACLDLHELSSDPAWLDRAETLAGHALAHHLRPDGAGFYFTADDAETLIERTESLHDAALPSGAAVAVELLVRLSAADRGPAAARGVAEATLRRFAVASAEPFGFAAMIGAARWFAGDAVHVRLQAPHAADVAALREVTLAARRRSISAFGLSFASASETSALVCRGLACSLPIADAGALADALREPQGLA